MPHGDDEGVASWGLYRLQFMGRNWRLVSKSRCELSASSYCSEIIDEACFAEKKTICDEVEMSIPSEMLITLKVIY